MSEISKGWALGVWCGAGSRLLAPVSEGVTLLRLVTRRCKLGTPLVPWTREHDHLAAEVKTYGRTPIRCHTDERIAMRDLVVRYGSPIGALVQGDCSAIDYEEILLGIARVESGWEEYVSARVRVLPRATWLRVSDSDEWAPLMDAEATRKFYWTLERQEQRTGELRARAAPES